MHKLSLSHALIKTKWIAEGLIEGADGNLYRALEFSPLSSGLFEDDFNGAMADGFFQKMADLLTRLPNKVEGQFIAFRKAEGNSALRTQLMLFERIEKAAAYSHLSAALSELQIVSAPVLESSWKDYLSILLGPKIQSKGMPDIIWERESVLADDRSIRVLSLTELPQVTWKACLQPVFESQREFVASLKFQVPERKLVRRKLETKRRVSHALSISSSLEVKNIESNSVLQSSEETLERILVSKETLFEISVAVMVVGTDAETASASNDFEKAVSGVGNAGLYQERVGALPVFISHVPGNKMMAIRTLPILSENFTHLLPLFCDYSRANDESSLPLQSRSGEVSHLNLFSSENLNFNAFICGASGSGKSFLMNAVLASLLKDEAATRLCIFDIGGSYRKLVDAYGGSYQTLTPQQARELIASFVRLHKVDGSGFYRALLETLCGSGAHITHSHRVAIDELLREHEGEVLTIRKIIESAKSKPERFYLDISHWLKPHLKLDSAADVSDLTTALTSQVTAFDFKQLDSDPVLQRTTIQILSQLLWRDLANGKYKRTEVVFDEVWRFFAETKWLLEEMYRTFRKYRAGIVSITQNLADYGDEAFAKMIFTNSFTKIFLQNGASGEILKQTFDMNESDIRRALSVASKKPVYSEFFAVSPLMSQVFRLYPTKEFYELANSENVSVNQGA